MLKYARSYNLKRMGLMMLSQDRSLNLELRILSLRWWMWLFLCTLLKESNLSQLLLLNILVVRVKK
jgi:hypothetical protein